MIVFVLVVGFFFCWFFFVWVLFGFCLGFVWVLLVGLFVFGREMKREGDVVLDEQLGNVEFRPSTGIVKRSEASRIEPAHALSSALLIKDE